MDILATPDTTDTHTPTVCTMASVRLKLSPRLMLTPTFFMVDTTDTVLAMPDTTDTPMPTELPATERDLLMLSLRLMLILIFFMVDMLTMESALLMPSPRLMLTLTFCTEDMDMDTLDTMDTHMVDMPTTDKL